MSNRKTILAAIAHDPATVADLTDATGWPQRKVRDTIGDLKNVGLAVARRDDITGQPMYAITPSGCEWLASKKHPADNSTPQPAEGHISPAAEAVATSQAARSTATGPAVVEPPKQALKPAAARSDERKQPDAVAPTLEDLKPETVREICQAQRLTIDAMRMRMAMLEQEVEEKAQRIAALESNAELPLRTANPPAKYALTFLSELHDTPEAVMAGALQEYDPPGLESAVIVACETVGKIELRPMLVPA